MALDLGLGPQQDDEVGNVLGSLIFIAHCYVQDEPLPQAVGFGIALEDMPAKRVAQAPL